jgi:hypothetical protein
MHTHPDPHRPSASDAIACVTAETAPDAEENA